MCKSWDLLPPVLLLQISYSWNNEYSKCSRWFSSKASACSVFQYWRNPLPPIDLADIEDVSEDSLTETALQGKNEVAEIDMES